MKTHKPSPVAFLSVVRMESDADRNRLTRFREHLEAELKLQHGSDFVLLDDRNDLRWGQNWTERVRESLDQDSFLIPILTPGYFQSPPCREELELFMERERKLRRSDLIHPIYYVSTPTLDDRLQRSKDRLAEAIAGRDLLDWRELRFEPYTTPVVGKRLTQLAETLRTATGRSSIPGRATSRGHGSRKPLQLVGLHQQQAELSAGNGNGEHHEIPVLQYAELISGVSEVVRGAPEKSEPPQLVVDSMGKGQFKSVGEALQKANAGDRILIRPGRYNESLTVEKPIELLGDGPVDQIVLEASGASVIVFRASMGRIANLSIAQSGGGQGYGIEVSQGRIVIEGCDISSRGGAGVALHGGVEATLRGNRIHDGKGSGVLFCRDAQGVLEDNEIEGNALAGVLITRGARPKLYRNRIHDGLGTGVQIEDGGEALLEENDIAGHVLAEVAICRGGNPILRRNRIHDSHRSGVLVYENGLGLIEMNDFFGNGLAGVMVMTGGSPMIRRNRFHGGHQNGIFFCEHGQGTVEENDLSGSLHAEVLIQSGSNPRIHHNRIHDGKQNGIVVEDYGQGVVEDNAITAHVNAGVLIGTGGNPTLRRNRIHRNGHKAIIVESTGAGVVENNDLRDNVDGALEVGKDAPKELSLLRNRQ